MLALGVLVAVVLAGAGLLAYQLYWVPSRDKDRAIDALQQDVGKRGARVREVQAEMPKLERWRLLSLPADPDAAKVEYEKYLSEMMQDSGLTAGTFSITPKGVDSKTGLVGTGSGAAGKVQVYTRLTFAVQLHTSLAKLVTVLEQFYRTGNMQQIKTLSIQRSSTGSTQPQAQGQGQQQTDLEINFSVEALIVHGPNVRKNIVPEIDRRLLVADVITSMRQGPAGFALVGWFVGPTGPLGPRKLAEPARSYSAIAGKNIFFGPPQRERPPEEIELTQFVNLTDITHDSSRTEAFLYGRVNKRFYRLRAEPGFNIFRVWDDKGETKVRGKVVQIGARELIFSVDDAYYQIHIGQSLEDAMRQALKPSKLQEMGLIKAKQTVKKES
jgi:hypothetical protein